MANTTAEYDLFLDESGDFRETSTDPAELRASNCEPRVFPSQIAGVLARRGTLTKGEARKLLNHALAAASLLPGPVHANELPKHAREPFFLAIATGLRARGWQPVRVVNRERVRYGDRVTTYTSMVAELVLRVCERLALARESAVNLRLICSRVKLGEDTDGMLKFIDHAEYLQRVQEYLGFAAVRRGVSRESGAWRIDSFRLGSGKDDPELQLCDVLSYASHDDFRPCTEQAKAELHATLGAYDFTLSVCELNERVDRLVADDLLGAAVQALAEGLVSPGMASEARASAEDRLGTVLSRLARVMAPARDPQLVGVVNWLEQLVDIQRSLDLGFRITRWLQTKVLAPLRSALASGPEAGSLDWFAYALHTWALTASTHRGAVEDSRMESEGLKLLLPSLAGQWGHATLIMRGLVAEAVHRTDCFEFDHASSRMEVVAGYYDTLGSLFESALPSVFPARVRSDLCGRALGTWVQSEVYAGLQDGNPERFTRGRGISDRAIDEFPAVADKERQYQYRAQLETAAGRFADARAWLARSLRLGDDGHAALAACIGGLTDVSPTAQGFALLHWIRLGVTALLDDDRSEGDAFLAAVRASDVLNWSWSRGEQGTDYPAQGILRRVAVIRACTGEPSHAAECLARLGVISPAREGKQAVLATIRLAAHAETAAVLWPTKAKAARPLLEGSVVTFLGLLQQLERFRLVTEAAFPRLWSVFEPWTVTVRRLLGGDVTARPELLRLARRIGF